MNDIKEQIYNVLSNIIKVDDKLTSDSNLFDEYSMGSLDVVDLIINLEEVYEIEFIDDDLALENFESINKIIELIKMRTKNNG